MRSQTEKKIWRDKIIAISKKIKSMSDQDKKALWIKIGTTNPEGHMLSVYNTISLYMQSGKCCVQVAGFKQWLRYNRRVIKGQHSIGSILIPMYVTDKNDSENTETADIKFKPVAVFDIDQTEEITEAETTENKPAWE